jgi:hypothetical protein
MNMNGAPPPLRFERIRSFGRIFGDTRRFVRENFAVFFKTILFLVGPVALVTCSLEKFYEVKMATDDPQASFMHMGSLLAKTQIFSQLRWAINGFITAIVVSHFVKVYREKGHGKFEVNDVTKSIFRDFFGNVFTLIFMFLSVAFISIVLGFVIYGLAEVSIESAIVIGFTGSLAYFLVRFPFWYFVYSVFIARTSSGTKNVFEGITLAGKVFAGSWWWTWVLMFCMWLLLYIIGTCISMPASIIAIIAQLASINPEKNVNWKLIESVLLSLAEFGKTIINSIFMITVALHFYGLKEKVDGEGTKKVVEMIGTKNEDEEIELTY